MIMNETMLWTVICHSEYNGKSLTTWKRYKKHWLAGHLMDLNKVDFVKSHNFLLYQTQNIISFNMYKSLGNI